MKTAFGAFLTMASCFVGFQVCSDPASEHCPADFSGRTSIVVELENGDWCELRGPGRFAVLDGFAPPDNPVRNVDSVRSAQQLGIAGWIENPHYTASE